MTVSATLKGKKDSLGRRKIFIRINNGTYRKFFTTQLRVKPSDWKKGKATGPNAKQINDAIRASIIKIEQGLIPQTKDISFHDYAIKCFNDWDKSKKSETIRSLTSKLAKFDRFKPKIKLSSITPDTLNDFVEYCYSEGNSTNTVWGALKFMRLIILKAHKEKMIFENPFSVFEMPKYKDPPKLFLTKDQVNIIERTELPEGYELSRNWFLISCYTGLRFGDMAKFNKKQIRDGRLIIYTSKTGQPVSIKLNDKLVSLFSKVHYRPLPYHNVHYNRILKAIAAICELPEISAHTARHTFGTLCASAGISQEVTAKLMAHSSIKTTAIYYQLTADRLDSEIEKIF